MEKENKTKPPPDGILYGEITRWLIMVSVIIAIIGSIVYFISGGYLDKQVLITNLWQNNGSLQIWQTCASDNAPYQASWYLHWLTRGDAIAMLGITMACFAGVIGMWGTLLGTIINKRGIYIILALVTAVILTLSAFGILKVEIG